MLAAQEGVISLDQLRAAGLGDGAIRHRVRMKRLVAVYRRVYAPAGVRVSPKGRLWAAFLACQPGAVASHRSAAALWELQSWPARPELSAERDLRVSGIRIHRAKDLTDVVVIDNLPRTTVACTLLDLTDVLPPFRVELAWRRADQLRLLDVREIEDVLDRANGRRGVKTIGALMRRNPQGVPDSPLAARVLRIIIEADLHEPLVNHVVWIDDTPYRPDFFWPHRNLAVEADGYETHRTAFTDDRTRDIRLKLAGIDTLRFTHGHTDAFIRASLLGLLA